MLVVVYGTLKRGYGNNRILAEGNATFIKDVIIHGFKLYNSGFPVAARSEGSSINAELWDIHANGHTLDRLDMLEGEGRMYHREIVETNYVGEFASMYVGHDDFWNFRHMNECPSDDGLYTWSR